MFKMHRALLLGSSYLAAMVNFSPADSTYTYNEDADLDDIEDLASFDVWHSGSVMAKIIQFDKKEINNHIAWAWKLEFLEALEWTEQPKAGEEYAKAEDTMDISFMMDNAVGAGFMKKFLTPLSEGLKLEGKAIDRAKATVGATIIVAGLRTPATETGADGKKVIIPGKFYYRVANVLVP